MTASTDPAMTPAGLRAAADAEMPWIVDVRRRLHRIPEIGLHIPLTQALVAEEVRRLGLQPSPG